MPRLRRSVGGLPSLGRQAGEHGVDTRRGRDPAGQRRPVNRPALREFGQTVLGVEGQNDVARLGLEPGAALAIEARRVRITLTARTDPLMPEGMVFVPFCYVEAAANMLTNPALDPYGKIPEFKYAACKLGAGDRPV